MICVSYIIVYMYLVCNIILYKATTKHRTNIYWLLYNILQQPLVICYYFLCFQISHYLSNALKTLLCIIIFTNFSMAWPLLKRYGRAANAPQVPPFHDIIVFYSPEFPLQCHCIISQWATNIFMCFYTNVITLYE